MSIRELLNSSTKPYMIAEIGINHNGDLQIAKKLIDAAFVCNWNVVKFQKRTPDIAVPEKQKEVMRDTPWGRMTYLDYKKKIEFEKEEYDLIDDYCNHKPISWTASPWDLQSLYFLTQYNIPFIKIPSAMLTNDELLTKAARTGKPLFVSTGMSTIDEVDHAVEILEEEANDNYLLMHTNSSYPANTEELNLSMISVFQERYGCPVGYSGHEESLMPSVIAVAMGACAIERHVTLDRTMWGTDQAASVSIPGMYALRRRVDSVASILGDGKKVITDDEQAVRLKLRG